jgi:predicted anti-sigma-YlaC factor YlaD
MNCTDVAKHITSMVDNELSGVLFNQLKEHLNNCDKCRALCMEFKCCKKMISSKLTRYTASDALKGRITSYINSQLN